MVLVLLCLHAPSCLSPPGCLETVLPVGLQKLQKFSCLNEASGATSALITPVCELYGFISVTARAAVNHLRTVRDGYRCFSHPSLGVVSPEADQEEMTNFSKFFSSLKTKGEYHTHSIHLGMEPSSHMEQSKPIADKPPDPYNSNLRTCERFARPV